METGEVLLAPGRNSWRKVSPITVDTGKGLKARGWRTFHYTARTEAKDIP
jgi:hypothetical protein